MQPQTRARIARSIGIAAIAVLGLSACSSASAGSESSSSGSADWLADLEPRVLTFSEINSQTKSTTQGILDFQEYITDATDGKITFENYWSASLVPPTEMLTAAGDGLVDITYTSPTYHPDILPTMSWLLEFGSQTDPDFDTGFVTSSMQFHEFLQTDEEVLAEFASANVHPIFGYTSQRYPLICNSPVETVEDAAGKQTRVAGGVWTAEVDSLGMTPTFTPLTEMYEALQRGVVDCAVIVEDVVPATSLWDVAKYVNPAGFSAINGHTYVMNLDVWSSFPPELQQIFEEAALVRLAGWFPYVFEDVADVLVGTGATEHGIEVLNPRELNEALAAGQSKAFAAMVENAPARVADPQATIDAYRVGLDSWLDEWREAGLPEESGDYLEDVKNSVGLDISPMLERLRERLKLA